MLGLATGYELMPVKQIKSLERLLRNAIDASFQVQPPLPPPPPPATPPPTTLLFLAPTHPCPSPSRSARVSHNSHPHTCTRSSRAHKLSCTQAKSISHTCTRSSRTRTHMHAGQENITLMHTHITRAHTLMHAGQENKARAV